MADIFNAIPDMESLDDDELREIIMRVRKKRIEKASPKKRAKPAKKEVTLPDVSKMTDDEKRKLLASLMEDS